MKKAFILVATMACMTAFAGLDTYVLTYTSLLTPAPIGRVLLPEGGAATNFVEYLSITNAAAGPVANGVNISGLQGKGTILLRASGTGPGTVEFVLTQCATTNGTYTVITNNSVAAYTVALGAATNVAFTPNNWSQYIRTKATVTTGTVTNGGVSAALVSY
jgi:hypothetical protein